MAADVVVSTVLVAAVVCAAFAVGVLVAVEDAAEPLHLRVMAKIQ